jgi:hypothetical protein
MTPIQRGEADMKCSQCNDTGYKTVHKQGDLVPGYAKVYYAGTVYAICDCRILSAEDTLMTHVIGRCSCCGGNVVVPVMWAGLVPPTPTCVKCGAKARQTYLPVIETVPNNA